MKNSIPKGDPKGLAAVLDALSLLDKQELNARWKALYGSEPPDRSILKPPRRNADVHAVIETEFRTESSSST